MNQFRISLLGLLTILFLVQPRISVAQESFDTQKLDAYLSTLEDYDKFMGSVAILENDEILFHNAYGFVNEDEKSAHSETVYRIGSVTKTYTATILLKLIEEGKIKLTDSLSEFFPRIPNADKITIEHLLHHRSGLVNMTNVQEYQEYYLDEVTRKEMLDRFVENGTNFEPGEKFEYSNTGYVLLGYIIEDVTGMSYAEALEEYITELLDLDRTYYGSDISTDREEAHSFAFNSGNWELNSETDMSVPHGAGAIVSTPTETALFLNALFDGKLISEESLAEMKNLQDGYGLGINRLPFYERAAWGHNGGIDGFQSMARHFIEDDITFVLFGNGVNDSMNDIAIGVLSIVFDRDFEIPDFSNEPDPVELTEKEMTAYTGSFSSDDIPLNIEVFLENGSLMAQATGQGAFPLSAFEGSIMKFEQAGITMVFDRLENGKYQAFELQQGGQKFSFDRDEE